jgi:hypothetical protein
MQAKNGIVFVMIARKEHAAGRQKRGGGVENS